MSPDASSPKKKLRKKIRRTVRRIRRMRARLRHSRPTAPPVATGGARLVPSPVFVLCSVRSGSTLLRVLLNSHSKICAPHELHLRSLKLKVDRAYAEKAVDLLGLDTKELEHLLWDRILHRELQLSGKALIVDKTPANVTAVPRLLECWPQARFIILLRHPLSIAQSYQGDSEKRTLDAAIAHVSRYLEQIESARTTLGSSNLVHTVRYEDLTSDPATATKGICEFLGVPWEAEMLDYGKQKHGPFKSGVGDWGKKIRSGKIQPSRPLPSPDEVPDDLMKYARSWGYLD